MIYFFRSEKFREAIRDCVIALIMFIPIGLLECYASKKISEIYGYNQSIVLTIIVMIVNTIVLIIGIVICLWYKRKIKEEKEINKRQIVILKKYSKLITEDNFMEMIEKQDKEIEAMRKEVRASRL